MNKVKDKIVVEWSRSTILSFIADYKNNRLLWDPAIKEYHIKSNKYAALKQLSEKYGIEIRAIRCKIKSLRSSFHREHGKVKYGQLRGMQYRPMWFAYDAMKFILESEVDSLKSAVDFHKTITDNINVEESVDKSDEVMNLSSDAFKLFSLHTFHSVKAIFQTEDEKPPTDDTAIDSNHVKVEMTENDVTKVKAILSASISRKRKHSKTDANYYSMEHQATPNTDDSSLVDTKHSVHNFHQNQNRRINCNSDEFDVFGDYVGMTVRTLRTETSKIAVKHLINNILFEAEMGKYDNGIPTTRAPPNLYWTPDGNCY